MPATAFKSITAPKKPGERDENETTKGLRVSDKGFLNTAVIQSEITYIDGEAGGEPHIAFCLLWSLTRVFQFSATGVAIPNHVHLVHVG